ncbi:unnamed protein product [Allacma fusca]|uniref:Luciferin 4-monooxygenase n=1 Tax=Allacma fusca TaxID=39272 RepID=A0A8J2JPU0_9HEXA|nr:unnamed protein product [Allacma fusca]
MARGLYMLNRQFTNSLKKSKKISHGIERASFYSTSIKSNPELEDESLWVNSKIQDVKTIVGVTIPEMIRANIRGWENAVAFECAESGRKYTHRQVLEQSRGFAAAMIQSGYKRGDVIGVVLHNIPEYCAILYGIWEAGLVASPVNPAYTAAEITRQLESSGAQGVVTLPDYLEACRAAKTANPKIKSIVIVGEPHEGCHSYYEMVKADTTGVDFAKGSQMDTLNDTILLPYSSGTTGLPKGVMLTHSNLTTNLLQSTHPTYIKANAFEGQNEQERLLGLLPFFHSYGLACILNVNMLKGSHTLTLPRFEVNSFVRAIRQQRPTIMHMVTPLINFMVNSADFTSKEFEATETVIGGAAPIGPSLINQLLEKANKHMLFQEGYGMTELSPVSHFSPLWTNNQKVGSCGCPVPSTSTKIVDVISGKTLPRFERGEICVRGPQVMKGYFNNEEATRNTIDVDGWCHTGDIGYYDNDDCLWIVDRLKELIKVKGFQVAPSELEDLLRGHEKVEDVAVIGVPDAEWGELPRAYIVKKDGQNLVEDELNHFLKDQVTSYKQLRGGIEFVKAIPKAPTGKILRRELLTAYKEMRGLQ